MAKEKEIQQILKEFQAENRQQFKKINEKFEAIDQRFEAIDKRFKLIEDKIDEKAEETKRYFGVIAESLEHKIKIVAEQVSANTEKLYEHDQRFNNLDEAVEHIQQQLNKTQNLQKSDHKEIKEVVEFKRKLGLLKTETS